VDDGARGEVQAILDDPAENSEAVRRAALAALASVRGDAFAERLPRYFHDEDPYIRSEAVSAARTYQSAPGTRTASRAASSGSSATRRRTRWRSPPPSRRSGPRRGSGSGSPPTSSARSSSGRPTSSSWPTSSPRGEARGVHRLAWADAFFGWWAKELGLDEAGVEKALATRRAFWEAAEKGDLAGARRALDEHGSRPKGLLAYEEGWVEAH